MLENNIILQFLSLTEAFSILCFYGILCIGPYFSGYDSGKFKINESFISDKGKLKFLIPVCLLVLLFASIRFPFLQYLSKDERGYKGSYCRYSYLSVYNNIEEFKEVLLTEAKKDVAKKLFKNNLIDSMNRYSYTTEQEDMLLNVLKEYVIIEKEEYKNSNNFGESCISFQASQKPEDKMFKPVEFKNQYCASDMNVSLQKIQKEKENIIIDQLQEYEPLLRRSGRQEILSLVSNKLFFQEDLEGSKHCGIIKFSILPIELQAIVREDFRIGEFEIIPRVTGVDKNQKEAKFQFAILSNQYNWKYESDSQIELNGVVANIYPLLSSKEMISNFRATAEIISVGTASCEGQNNLENERAYARAINLDKWLKQVLEKHEDLKAKETYTLTLGKYREECSLRTEQKTALQRRVIIISIIYRDKEVNLSEALYDAMKNRPNLSFDIENYGDFRLEKS